MRRILELLRSHTHGHAHDSDKCIVLPALLRSVRAQVTVRCITRSS